MLSDWLTELTTPLHSVHTWHRENYTRKPCNMVKDNYIVTVLGLHTVHLYQSYFTYTLSKTHSRTRYDEHWYFLNASFSFTAQYFPPVTESTA